MTKEPKKDQFEETLCKEIVKKFGEDWAAIEDRYYERLQRQLIAYEDEKKDKLKIASLEKRVLELELAIDRLARATDGNNWAGVPRYRDQKHENEKKDKKQENKS